MAGSLAAPLMVEMAKQLSDIGRLKPSSLAAAAASGPPFQINIQVNGLDVVHSHAPQELVPVAEVATEMVIDFAPGLPPPPPALKVPDFDLRPSALVGTAQAQHAARGVDTPHPSASSAVAQHAAGASPAGPSRSLDTQPGASSPAVGLPTRARPA
jgi:hypothetical protein